MSQYTLTNLPGVNYYEFFLCNQKDINDSDIQSYKIGLDVDTFYEIMSKMKNVEYKCFQKEYKEYIHKDLTCQSYINDDVKVFRKTNSFVNWNEKYLIIGSTFNKLTLLNFPSTTNIQQTSYIKQQIFRINNRTYLNFKVSIDSDTKEKTYTIYLNYNHEENVDVEMINKNINEIMNLILT